jgi:hypothetical protein
MSKPTKPLCVVLDRPGLAPTVHRFDDLAKANPEAFVEGDEQLLRDGRTIAWAEGSTLSREECDLCRGCGAPIAVRALRCHACAHADEGKGYVANCRMADLKARLFAGVVGALALLVAGCSGASPGTLIEPLDKAPRTPQDAAADPDGATHGPGGPDASPPGHDAALPPPDSSAPDAPDAGPGPTCPTGTCGSYAYMGLTCGGACPPGDGCSTFAFGGDSGTCGALPSCDGTTCGPVTNSYGSVDCSCAAGSVCTSASPPPNAGFCCTTDTALNATCASNGYPGTVGHVCPTGGFAVPGCTEVTTSEIYCCGGFDAGPGTCSLDLGDDALCADAGPGVHAYECTGSGDMAGCTYAAPGVYCCG